MARLSSELAALEAAHAEALASSSTAETALRKERDALSEKATSGARALAAAEERSAALAAELAGERAKVGKLRRMVEAAASHATRVHARFVPAWDAMSDMVGTLEAATQEIAASEMEKSEIEPHDQRGAGDRAGDPLGDEGPAELAS